MDKAREMIAALMTRRESEFGRAMTPIEIADGLIAAMPEIIKDMGEGQHATPTDGFEFVQLGQKGAEDVAAALLMSGAERSTHEIDGVTVVASLRMKEQGE